MSAPAATSDHGIRLLEKALKRFEIYTGKPLFATQPRTTASTRGSP